jgi:hypothetical protein
MSEKTRNSNKYNSSLFVNFYSRVAIYLFILFEASIQLQKQILEKLELAFSY